MSREQEIDDDPNAGGDTGGEDDGAGSEGLVDAAGEEEEAADDGDDGPAETKGKAGGAKFSPEQQSVVNGLLAKEKRGRKEAEEKYSEANRELEDYRKRYGDADGDTVLKAAQEAGVMPEVLTADAAKGVLQMESAKANSRYFSRLLRNDPDAEEYEVKGQKMTRKEVVRQASDWEDEAERLEKRYGPVKARASEESAKIWKLGLAAKKRGWTPESGKTRTDTPEGRKPAGADKQRRNPAPGDEPALREAASPRGGANFMKEVAAGKMTLEEALRRQELEKQKAAGNR
jgi:hypothetical protein